MMTQFSFCDELSLYPDIISSGIKNNHRGTFIWKVLLSLNMSRSYCPKMYRIGV